MDITVVCEDRYCDYIIDVLSDMQRDCLSKVNIPWETINGKSNLADCFIDYE